MSLRSPKPVVLCYEHGPLLIGSSGLILRGAHPVLGKDKAYSHTSRIISIDDLGFETENTRYNFVEN